MWPVCVILLAFDELEDDSNETYVPASQDDAFVPWSCGRYFCKGTCDGSQQILRLVVDLTRFHDISRCSSRLFFLFRRFHAHLDIQQDPNLLCLRSGHQIL